MTTFVSRPRGLRGIVAAVVVIAFSIAALIGIAVLVRGGELGDTEARILGTTALIGVASLAVLCCLTGGGVLSRLIGAAGIVATLLPLTAGLVMTWDWAPTHTEGWFKALAAGAVLAFSLAHAAMLTAIATRSRLELGVLVVTVGLVAVVASMVLPFALRDGFDPGESYVRTLGVLAILDVLGTIALPAMTRMRATPTSAAAETDPTPGAPSTPCERLTALAKREGRTPGDVLTDALDAYEHASAPAARVAHPV